MNKSLFAESPWRCHWWQPAGWIRFSGPRQPSRCACLLCYTWMREEIDICSSWNPHTMFNCTSAVVVYSPRGVQEQGCLSFLPPFFSSLKFPQCRFSGPRFSKVWPDPRTRPRLHSPIQSLRRHFLPEVGMYCMFYLFFTILYYTQYTLYYTSYKICHLLVKVMLDTYVLRGLKKIIGEERFLGCLIATSIRILL